MLIQVINFIRNCEYTQSYQYVLLDVSVPLAYAQWGRYYWIYTTGRIRPCDAA